MRRRVSFACLLFLAALAARVAAEELYGPSAFLLPVWRPWGDASFGMSPAEIEQIYGDSLAAGGGDGSDVPRDDGATTAFRLAGVPLGGQSLTAHFRIHREYGSLTEVTLVSAPGADSEAIAREITERLGRSPSVSSDDGRRAWSLAPFYVVALSTVGDGVALVRFFVDRMSIDPNQVFLVCWRRSGAEVAAWRRCVEDQIASMRRFAGTFAIHEECKSAVLRAELRCLRETEQLPEAERARSCARDRDALLALVGECMQQAEDPTPPQRVDACLELALEWVPRDFLAVSECLDRP